MTPWGNDPPTDGGKVSPYKEVRPAPARLTTGLPSVLKFKTSSQFSADENWRRGVVASQHVLHSKGVTRDKKEQVGDADKTTISPRNCSVSDQDHACGEEGGDEHRGNLLREEDNPSPLSGPYTHTQSHRLIPSTHAQTSLFSLAQTSLFSLAHAQTSLFPTSLFSLALLHLTTRSAPSR